MDWYKRYIGDYARDTGALTLTEHGCYMLLLDHYYATEKPLPAELDVVFRICKARSEHEKKAARRVLAKFFPMRGKQRRNARADKEIAAADRARAEQSEAGRRGAERRWGRLADSSPISRGNLAEASRPARAASSDARSRSITKVATPMGDPIGHPTETPMALQTPDSRRRDTSVVSGEVKPGPGSVASVLSGRNGKHRPRAADPDPDEARVARALVLLEQVPETTEADAARMFRVTIDQIRAARGGGHGEG